MVLLSTMSSSSDLGVLTGAVQWADEGSYVKEITSRGPLPLLAKAIKGQYLNIGVPSLANPSLSSTLLLLSGGKCIRVAAQCVKFKEGRRVVPVGSKMAIPENYEGFFEILSEDGRAVRCMETVTELSKRFPDSCLVRETVKGFVARHDDVESVTDKSRSVQVGETLVLVGEVLGGVGGKNNKAQQQQRFLRCFDQNGQSVFLPMEAKGKFSAIAKEENISGVHSIKNLLNKRLPIMVRLIHGKPPVGPKMSQFLPELRLFAAFKEEALAALPLGKESPLVLLPPSAPLKLTVPKNFDAIEKTKEFHRLKDRSLALLKDLSERIHVYDVNMGNKSAGGSKDPRFFRMSEQSKHRAKHSHPHRIHKIKSPLDKKILNTDPKANSPAKADDYDEIDQIYDYVRGFAPLPKHIKSPYASEPSVKRLSISSKIDTRPVPPPIETIPSRKGLSEVKTSEKLSPSVHPALISAVLEKAERKVEKTEHKKTEFKKLDYKKLDKADRRMEKGERKVEKRLHASEEKKASPPAFIHSTPSKTESKCSGKLFVKAAQQRSTKSRIFRHKSSSPVKDAILDIVSNGPHLGLVPNLNHGAPPVVHPVNNNNNNNSAPSPLFKMRYKSLTNLVMDFDTIDSSTSKNSTDSCGSVAHRNKLPEKRSRRLPRPKSLTNLVFDNGTEHSSPFTGGGGNARALLEAERKLRLEPGVYRHARDAPALIAATSRMLASQKKIGTLYL